jgi:hypothetical protein
VHGLDLGIDDVPLDLGGMLLAVRPVRRRHRRRAGVVLALLFNKTRIGLLRAVADDPWRRCPSASACPHLGVVWAVAGFVGLVAGLLWGARLGVQFSLSLVVLKALPVLIGGFTSSAARSSADHRRQRKVAEVYLGRSSAAASKTGFPMSWLLFLLVRPAGLFGERAERNRVLRKCLHALSRSRSIDASRGDRRPSVCARTASRCGCCWASHFSRCRGWAMTTGSARSWCRCWCCPWRGWGSTC